MIISSEKVMTKACALVLYKLFLFSVHKEQLTCNCMRCNLESGPILSNTLWNYRDKIKCSFEGNAE